MSCSFLWLELWIISLTDSLKNIFLICVSLISRSFMDDFYKKTNIFLFEDHKCIKNFHAQATGIITIV